MASHSCWTALADTVLSADLPEVLVSWLAALLRYRGDDSIYKLVSFFCEAACSTRALYPACSHDSLWAEEPLSELQVGVLHQAWGSSSLPMLFTFTCFFSLPEFCLCIKMKQLFWVRDALHLMLGLFCVGSVMDNKRSRRLNTIPTEKKYTV